MKAKHLVITPVPVPKDKAGKPAAASVATRSYPAVSVGAGRPAPARLITSAAPPQLYHYG